MKELIIHDNEAGQRLDKLLRVLAVVEPCERIEPGLEALFIKCCVKRILC